MRTLFLLLLLAFGAPALRAQTVDSIAFHLYTDSLKKGQYNYINVDGKLSNGRWRPLTSRELEFTCPEAAFSGNELILPDDFPHEKVTITATLRQNPALRIHRILWVKKLPDPELPPRRH